MSQYRVQLTEDELDGGWVAIGWVLLAQRVAALNGGLAALGKAAGGC